MAGNRKPSAAAIATGTLALRRVNARRHLMTKCRAMSKTTGQQCRQLPMKNGLCYYHGGRTPKGKDWHKPQWPKKSSPVAERKMVARLRDLQRNEKQRQKRLAKMSAEERAAYDKWHRDRPLGTPTQRLAKRLARKQNEEARARFLQPRPDRPADPEMAAIEARIAELRAQIAAEGKAAPDEQNAAESADLETPDLWRIFG